MVIHVKVDFGIVHVVRQHITAVQLFGSQWSGISDANSVFEGHVTIF